MCLARLCPLEVVYLNSSVLVYYYYNLDTDSYMHIIYVTTTFIIILISRLRILRYI